MDHLSEALESDVQRESFDGPSRELVGAVRYIALGLVSERRVN